jgi:hypothetical protein
VYRTYLPESIPALSYPPPPPSLPLPLRIATAAAILHSGHHHHQSFPLRHLQHNNNLRDFEQK